MTLCSDCGGPIHPDQAKAYCGLSVSHRHRGDCRCHFESLIAVEKKRADTLEANLTATYEHSNYYQTC